MKVIYAIGGCVFNGGGIGTTAYHGVAGIYRHRLLSQLIVNDYRPSEIDPNLIAKVPGRIRGLRHIVGEKWANFVQDLIFARVSSRSLTPGTIFHGWAGMSLEALQKAKSQGAITVLNRASSHILEAQQIIETEYQNWGRSISPYVQWAIQRELEEYEIADYICVPSLFSRDSFRQRGFSPDKIRMIPFGTNPISDAQAATCFRTTPSRTGLNALFVGEVGLRKGILYALQAWQKAQINKGRFFVVGPITQDIQPLLKNFQNDPSIQFTGFANSHEYFPQTDIFIFPSLEEGSALVTYEAMAYGLPAITTYNAGSMIEDGQEGAIVPVRNADAIQAALEQMADDADRMLEMSQKARQKSRGYTWGKYGENLVREYKKLDSHNQSR